MIYQIECDNGHKYTQETTSAEDKYERHPYQCGACGSKDIRVWAMVYDALTVAIKERMKSRVGEHGK